MLYICCTAHTLPVPCVRLTQSNSIPSCINLSTSTLLSYRYTDDTHKVQASTAQAAAPHRCCYSPPLSCWTAAPGCASAARGAAAAAASISLRWSGYTRP